LYFKVYLLIFLFKTKDTTTTTKKGFMILSNKVVGLCSRSFPHLHVCFQMILSATCRTWFYLKRMVPAACSYILTSRVAIFIYLPAFGKKQKLTSAGSFLVDMVLDNYVLRMWKTSIY